jgi:hypothetical protein
MVGTYLGCRGFFMSSRFSTGVLKRWPRVGEKSPVPRTRNFAFGSTGEVTTLHGDVRFAPESDQISDIKLGPLGASSRDGRSKLPSEFSTQIVINRRNVAFINAARSS